MHPERPLIANTAPFIRGRIRRLISAAATSQNETAAITGACGRMLSERRTPAPTTWQTIRRVR
jgi:hypothetical protein